MSVRVPRPKVGSPIIFRAQTGKDAPEFQVRPCSARHRDLFLSGYIILSCSKCTKTIRRLDEIEATS